MDAQDFRSLQEAYLDVYENEQLDELSVNKMHDYINKAEKDRARLNKKWDQGTATSKERKKVFDREEGEARASKKIRQKTGKDSFRLNALDKLKSAITKESYDIFDAILEHLIAEGYADTNESALVIMANMSEEWREEIINEAAADQSDNQIEKGVKTTYKAQGVLVNHRSPGLNRVPYADRKAKVKRMEARLKTRRDDLFGERNRREDETRAEMKRKYGL